MQPSVALSSMESEYMAASAAAQEAMWMNRLLEQLGFKTVCNFNGPPSESRHLHVVDFLMGLRMAFHYLAWHFNSCFYIL